MTRRPHEGLRAYQVGGGVRDALLGLSGGDIDWVVVGATPEEMVHRGFRPVGADFPVFLHPHTREEYALARRERKQGVGYKGFAVVSGADVTLEEDLLRRDLTINAMALEPNGSLIDPCQGRRDILTRQLRHVSPAFVEDPLRVLRVARFHAHLAAHGFTVAPETLQLMADIAASGELDHLTPERVWMETAKALATARPWLYFETLLQVGALIRLFPELAALVGVPQPEEYHAEGDAWVHTLAVLRQATLLTPDPRLRLAALLHDLGKGTTPAHELPHHYDHEHRGVPLVEGLCQRLRIPNAHRRLAVLVTRCHLRCHRVLTMRPGRIVQLLEEVDAFHQPRTLHDLLLVCLADARGHGGREDDPYPQAAFLWECWRVARAVDGREWGKRGIHGPRLGELLHQERTRRVKVLCREVESEHGEPA